MKRAAVLIAILLAVAATGCASAPASTTDSALITHRAPAASGKTVVVNCLFKQQTRPSSFVLTCADAGDVLVHLHWVSWGSGAAFAAGIEQVNNCRPDCAAGKFVSYPVLVDLWRPEPLPAHPGTFYFSRVTRVYTANRPPLYFCDGTRATCYPQTSTFDLWS
jgi:hypothetical protein